MERFNFHKIIHWKVFKMKKAILTFVIIFSGILVLFFEFTPKNIDQIKLKNQVTMNQNTASKMTAANKVNQISLNSEITEIEYSIKQAPTLHEMSRKYQSYKLNDLELELKKSKSYVKALSLENKALAQQLSIFEKTLLVTELNRQTAISNIITEILIHKMQRKYL